LERGERMLRMERIWMLKVPRAKPCVKELVPIGVLLEGDGTFERWA
jgi:hypothetical protein